MYCNGLWKKKVLTFDKDVYGQAFVAPLSLLYSLPGTSTDFLNLFKFLELHGVKAIDTKIMSKVLGFADRAVIEYFETKFGFFAKNRFDFSDALVRSNFCWNVKSLCAKHEFEVLTRILTLSSAIDVLKNDIWGYLLVDNDSIKSLFSDPKKMKIFLDFMLYLISLGIKATLSRDSELLLLTLGSKDAETLFGLIDFLEIGFVRYGIPGQFKVPVGLLHNSLTACGDAARICRFFTAVKEQGVLELGIFDLFALNGKHSAADVISIWKHLLKIGVTCKRGWNFYHALFLKFRQGTFSKDDLRGMIDWRHSVGIPFHPASQLATAPVDMLWAGSNRDSTYVQYFAPENLEFAFHLNLDFISLNSMYIDILADAKYYANYSDWERDLAIKAEILNNRYPLIFKKPTPSNRPFLHDMFDKYRDERIIFLKPGEPYRIRSATEWITIFKIFMRLGADLEVFKFVPKLKRGFNFTHWEPVWRLCAENVSADVLVNLFKEMEFSMDRIALDLFWAEFGYRKAEGGFEPLTPASPADEKLEPQTSNSETESQ
jgi:hypothetical protein